MSTDAIRASDEHARTAEVVGGVVGERCANCKAPLAPDQRYCVNCGERRGRPRFSYEAITAQAGAAPAAAALPAPPRSRGSSGTTLVAGIATLLIAMGVGVLIGENSSSSTPVRASAPAVITVGGSGTPGAAAAGTGAAASGGTAAATHTKGAKGGKVKVTVVHVTPRTAKAATAAASKVLGSSNSLSKNVQQQVGGKCTGGAGCQNGTFTGNFFPGG